MSSNVVIDFNHPKWIERYPDVDFHPIEVKSGSFDTKEPILSISFDFTGNNTITADTKGDILAFVHPLEKGFKINYDGSTTTKLDENFKCISLTKNMIEDDRNYINTTEQRGIPVEHMNIFFFDTPENDEFRQHVGFVSINRKDIKEIFNSLVFDNYITTDFYIQDHRIDRGFVRTTFKIIHINSSTKNVVSSAYNGEKVDFKFSTRILPSEREIDEFEKDFITRSWGIYKNSRKHESYMRGIFGTFVDLPSGKEPYSSYQLYPLSLSPLYEFYFGGFNDDGSENERQTPDLNDRSLLDMLELFRLYLEHAIERAIPYNVTEEKLQANKPLILGYLMTILCNSCPYSSDVMKNQYGKIINTDDLGEISFLLQGDCEDYSRYMLFLKYWMRLIAYMIDDIEIPKIKGHNQHKNNEKVKMYDKYFKDIMKFSNNYFACASLVGVSLSPINDDRLSQQEIYDKIISHEFICLVDQREIAQKMRNSILYTGNDDYQKRMMKDKNFMKWINENTTEYDGEDKYLPKIHCEGTDYVKSIVDDLETKKNTEISQIEEAIVIHDIFNGVKGDIVELFSQEQIFTTKTIESIPYKFVIEFIIPELIYIGSGCIEMYASYNREEEIGVNWRDFCFSKNIQLFGIDFPSIGHWDKVMENMKECMFPRLFKYPNIGYFMCDSSITDRQSKFNSSSCISVTDYYLNSSSSWRNRNAMVNDFIWTDRDRFMSFMNQSFELGTFEFIGNVFIDYQKWLDNDVLDELLSFIINKQMNGSGRKFTFYFYLSIQETCYVPLEKKNRMVVLLKSYKRYSQKERMLRSY